MFTVDPSGDDPHSRPAEAAPGPTSAEEILEEWRVAVTLSDRLKDPLWQVKSDLDLPAYCGRKAPPPDRPDCRPAPGPFYYRSKLPPPHFEPGEVDWMCVDRPAIRARKARPPGFRNPPGFRDKVRLLFRMAYRRVSGIAYYSGAEVVDGFTPETALRMRSLIAGERALHSDVDYGMLVAPACVFLELVIAELFRPLNRPHSVFLAETLDLAGRSRQAELLRKWSNGGLPMTMGLQVTLLAAMEKAEAGRASDIFRALGMTDLYQGLIRSGKLSGLLESVRTRYRNPACHGTATFKRADYEALAQMLLTRDHFRAWYRRGPVQLDSGLLDLHLRERYPPQLRPG